MCGSLEENKDKIKTSSSSTLWQFNITSSVMFLLEITPQMIIPCYVCFNILFVKKSSFCLHIYHPVSTNCPINYWLSSSFYPGKEMNAWKYFSLVSFHVSTDVHGALVTMVNPSIVPPKSHSTKGWKISWIIYVNEACVKDMVPEMSRWIVLDSDFLPRASLIGWHWLNINQKMEPSRKLTVEPFEAYHVEPEENFTLGSSAQQ